MCVCAIKFCTTLRSVAAYVLHCLIYPHADKSHGIACSAFVCVYMHVRDVHRTSHDSTLHCSTLQYIAKHCITLQTCMPCKNANMHACMQAYTHPCMHVCMQCIYACNACMHAMHACMHTLHYITLRYLTLHYITLHYIALHTYILTYLNTHMHACIHAYIQYIT